LAISPEKIEQTVNLVKPDFTICPFLQQKIPDDVCKNHLCMVFHPGNPVLLVFSIAKARKRLVEELKK
jgi:hypothetical protein